MIQGFFNDMIALMLAKFVLNDVPHAAGLTQEGVTPPATITRTKYTRYHMHCMQCGYDYHVALHTLYEWERCPTCGYGAPFEKFVR